VVAGQLLEVQSLSTRLGRRLPVRVDGVVPDGVSRVTIELESGESEKVPVARNGYEAVALDPLRVTFVQRMGAGLRRRALRLPLLAGAHRK
jgi:hypothetical protein